MKEKAVITDLSGVKIQDIIVLSTITKKVVTGQFVGGGKAKNTQTLDIITRTQLKPEIKPYKNNCVYDNETYLIVAIQSHNVTKQRFVKPQKQYTISLQ